MKEVLPIETEEDSWKGYDPNAPTPKKVSQKEIEEAVEEMKKPRGKAPIASYLALPLALIWGICHLYGLYVMVGTPLQAAVGLIIFANLLFLIHYALLLIINIGRHRHGTTV